MSKQEQAAIKKARAIRIKYYESLKKDSKENVKEEFKKFFVQKKHELNIDPSLEEAIWLHFKACGFDKKDKFLEGLKHFGF